MEDFSLALIWLGFFASIFFGWYFYLQARNKERMALIEKTGSIPELVKTREKSFRFSWFKFGMIIAGSGLGLCVSFLLMISPKFENIVRYTEGMVPIGLMLLFGGLGIVMAHFLEKSKEN